MDWVPARMLAPGDEILDYDGNTPLTVISNVFEETTERVCNFEVSGTHNYFAGDVGAWVHNDSNGILPGINPKRPRPAPFIPDDPFSPESQRNRRNFENRSRGTSCSVGPPAKLQQFELEKTTLGRIADALAELFG